MKRRFRELFLSFLLLPVTVGAQPLNSDSAALKQLQTRVGSLQQVLTEASRPRTFTSTTKIGAHYPVTTL